MKRQFARTSVSATPPARAVPVDSRESVSGPAPRPDAATPGWIDSDSLRDENQTGSNPIKATQGQSDRIKPQKIKIGPVASLFHESSTNGTPLTQSNPSPQWPGKPLQDSSPPGVIQTKPELIKVNRT